MSKKEADILVAIQKAVYDKPGVVAGARALSHYGEHAVGWMALSAVGMLVDPRRRSSWAKVGVSAVCAHAASIVIKRIVRRPRPHDSRIKVGVGTPSKLSFPSSHATSTAAALVATSKITHSSLPLWGIPVMMASRLVLGVHYPSDVALGALIGALTANIIMRKES